MKYFSVKTIVVLITTFNCFVITSAALAQNYTPLKIKGVLNAADKDSIEVIYRMCKLPEYLGNLEGQTIRVPISEGKFKLEIKENDPFYLTLVYKSSEGNRTELFKSYLAEPGDDISISFKTHFKVNKVGELLNIENIRFSGKGAEKYNCQYSIEQNEKVNLIKLQSQRKYRVDTGQFAGLWNAIHLASNLENGNYNILNRYQLAMSELAFEMMRINLYSKKMIIIYKQLKTVSKEIQVLKVGSRERFLVQYYLATDKPADFSNSLLSLSSLYASSLLLKYEFETLALNKKEKLARIYSIPHQSLKERVLTEYVLKDFTKFSAQNDVVDTVLKSIGDKDYIRLIHTMIRAQSIGAKVFDFSLPDVNGSLIKLSDYLGKVIFLDFWFTGCGGCAMYNRSVLSKVEKKFENDSNVVFIAVSIDKIKDSWIRSVREGLYTSPTAINLYTDGLGTNHPIIKQFAVTAYPRPIIIDKRGKLFSNKRGDLRISSERLSAVLLEAINSN
ncbi:TlpA family protein disulfide reductase [Pedobacter gandavensis]|uniref:Redoxin domain-containing protein n=1 Tax=Pedobacter gandavensis TaxID=2679963 RepID=A0ABR6EUM2_9SPHI|nr:TlpA disulfide reductase family protein [Pedobacter gandavensis]MBB2148958.1 redoxin domain-containing protein [Pedobacter gandavensis]